MVTTLIKDRIIDQQLYRKSPLLCRNRRTGFLVKGEYIMENSEQLLYWNNVPVMTTRMLAERLGIQERNIRDNFINNKEWYKPNEDFFFIKGNDLKELKKELQRFNRGSYQLEKNARHVYLWLESGAYNHAKTAETPEAWEAFLYLKDNYYIQKKVLKAIKEVHSYSESPLFPHTTRPVQVANSKVANKINFEQGGKKQTMEYNFKSCLLITGKTPKQLKEIAKKEGLKSKHRNSGKEVCRQLFPVAAATMSITDDMYNHGGKLEEIVPLCKSVMPVFEKMLELGMLPKGQHKQTHKHQ